MAHQAALAMMAQYSLRHHPPGRRLSPLSDSLVGGRRWRLSQAPDN
ncbi:MAG: hypothetical protein ACK47M_02125 [Caldilinea sp.]